MSKEKTENLYEEVLDFYNNSFKSMDNISKNIVNFYYSQYNYVDIELTEHINNEPFKWMKKNYKEWELKKEKLEKEKEQILYKIMKELKD